MRRFILALLWLLPSLAAAGEQTAPLPTHTLYPPLLRFFDPAPSSALRPPSASWQLDLFQHYGSVNLFDQTPGGRLLVDLELYLLETQLRRQFADELELSVKLPLLRPYNGLLDGPVQGLHKLLGVNNGGRELRPNNRMGYFYDNGRGARWLAENRWEIGNGEIGLRRTLAGNVDAQQGLALLAAVKLPTGSSRRGWGSGAADLGGGMVGSLAGDLGFAHLEGWLIHPFARDLPGLAYRNYARGSLALGWHLAPGLTPIVQLQGGLSPYRSGEARLDQPAWLIHFGAQSRQWQFVFSENLSQKTTQDFSFTLGYAWRQ